jgi:signal peptidase II
MSRILRTLCFLVALGAFVGCDQATKLAARDTLASSPPKSYLNGIVEFRYTENSGSFMGLGSTLPWHIRLIGYGATALLLGGGLLVVLISIQRIDRTTLIGLSWLFGGACGNLVDRVINRGQVIDFVLVDVGIFQTGVFNIADVLIIAGIAIILAGSRARKAVEA